MCARSSTPWDVIPSKRTSTCRACAAPPAARCPSLRRGLHRHHDRDYLRCSDQQRLPAELVAMYDDGTAEQGTALYRPN